MRGYPYWAACILRRVFSLTELTDLTKPFWHTFRAHKIVAPPPNPSPAGRGVVCEVTPTGLLAYFVEVLSLTELTDLTKPFWHTFRVHRRPSAYRDHRAFQLKMAVRFCDIG